MKKVVLFIILIFISCEYLSQGTGRGYVILDNSNDFDVYYKIDRKYNGKYAKSYDEDENIVVRELKAHKEKLYYESLYKYSLNGEETQCTYKIYYAQTLNDLSNGNFECKNVTILINDKERVELTF